MANIRASADHPRTTVGPRAVYASYEHYVRSIVGQDATLGWIYFIGPEGGPIKIGYSRDVDARLEGLQTGNHLDLKLWLVLPGTLGCERDYHRLFARCRIRGEWFHLTPALRMHIAERRSFAPKQFKLAAMERIDA